MDHLDLMKKFIHEEDGQTTTEYFLILAIVVTIFMQFRKKLLAILNKLLGGVETATDTALNDIATAGN